jgi:hypothetical protein
LKSQLHITSSVFVFALTTQFEHFGDFFTHSSAEMGSIGSDEVQDALDVGDNEMLEDPPLHEVAPVDDLERGQAYLKVLESRCEESAEHNEPLREE